MVEGGRSGGDDAHGRAETNEPTRIETRRLHRMPEFICGGETMNFGNLGVHVTACHRTTGRSFVEVTQSSGARRE